MQRRHAAARTLDLLLPRLAADLGNAADDRSARSLIALVVSTLAAVFLTEFAPPAVRRDARPGVRLLAGGAVGDLRADRDPRDRAVDRQTPDQQQRASSRSATSSSSTATNLTTAILILTLMILPIMVAISASALDVGAGIVARGLGRARRQPLAHDLARVAAHGAPGDRRRGGARDRTRARRGDHARDGRRRPRRSPPNPLDGFTVPVRAGAPARRRRSCTNPEG